MSGLSDSDEDKRVDLLSTASKTVHWVANVVASKIYGAREATELQEVEDMAMVACGEIEHTLRGLCCTEVKSRASRVVNAVHNLISAADQAILSDTRPPISILFALDEQSDAFADIVGGHRNDLGDVVCPNGGTLDPTRVRSSPMPSSRSPPPRLTPSSPMPSSPSPPPASDFVDGRDDGERLGNDRDALLREIEELKLAVSSLEVGERRTAAFMAGYADNVATMKSLTSRQADRGSLVMSQGAGVFPEVALARSRLGEEIVAMQAAATCLAARDITIAQQAERIKALEAEVAQQNEVIRRKDQEIVGLAEKIAADASEAQRRSKEAARTKPAPPSASRADTLNDRYTVPSRGQTITGGGPVPRGAPSDAELSRLRAEMEVGRLEVTRLAQKLDASRFQNGATSPRSRLLQQPMAAG